jgi:hypothetical protein
MTIDPSDCFGDEFENKKGPRFNFLTLGNKSPGAEPRQEDGKTFYGEKELAQFYCKNANKELEKVEPFVGVILFYTPSRKLAPFKGKETKTLCESFDGLAPSVNIESPFCAELDKATLEKQLLEKNLPEARVTQISSSVTSGGQLASCCYKGAKGGRWDLCPKSRKDPISGAKAPCTYFEKIFIHDFDSGRQFRADLKGLNLQNWSKYVSPWSEYKKFIWENQVPYWGAQVKISGAVGPNGFAVWNFTEPAIIEDPEVKKVADHAHNETFDWYNRIAAPPLEGKKASVEGEQQELDVDDVNW